VNTETRDLLRRYVERIENVEAERKALTDDIRMILNQAKGDGFDVKVLRQVLRLRRLSQAERDEAEALLATYMHAVDSQLELFAEFAEAAQ
jgi:uncharacterized protein (UPF0335 family)